MADYLARHDIDSRLIPLGPGRASLYAELPGELPGLIGLSGHLDTVQASDEWTRPPTTATVERGRVFGLGAADMKGGLAMMLAAFCNATRAIKSGRRPRHGLALLLSAGEETQFLGARDLYAAGLMENVVFMIIGEPTNGTVGMASLGGVLSRVTFEGKEAHAATPDKGINAILACARFLLAIEEQMPTLPVVQLSDDLAVRATVNVGTITGGRAHNIVPFSCCAELDMRCASDVQKKRYLTALEELAAEAAAPGTYHHEIAFDARSAKTPTSDPWVMCFADAYQRVTNRAPAFSVGLGSCDVVALAPDGGLPFVLFGPGDPARAHQPDEYIDLALLEDSLAVLDRFLEAALFERET